ncbi:MAG: ATP-dependent zinc metalloprotease FtsH [Anaerolineae bacterium]|nr:ATP-dependent zinc metalloprotease FtsH [Anaerolineae bacterium]
MDEQPKNNSGGGVPIWVWIITALAIVLGIQLWFSGGLNRPQEIPISEFMEQVKNGQINEFVVRRDRFLADLPNGTSISAAKGPTDTLKDLFEIYQVPQNRIGQLVIRNNNLEGWNTFLSIGFSILPILLLIWIFTRGFRQLQGGGGNSIFGFGRSRARTINDGDRPTVTFSDVAGVEEAKEEVQEVVQFLREPEKFVQVGARIPKGVLMVGPPGTGKTLLARAIAGEAGVPFFHISGSEFVEMFVGVGASRVRDLFDKAKQHAPSIVFVDEIDAVGRQRGAGLGGGHDEREQTLNQILVEMDGFSNETNVIVIAATNRADVLDPALLRPGRFDRKVVVDLPDVRGREAILKIHSRGKPITNEVSLSDMARLTAGFSGADLANLVNEAAIFAARRGRNQVIPLDFQDAFDRIVIGPERKSAVMSEEDKEVLAYHEAGHALVQFFLPHTDPVQKITIIPRGRAGGFVMSLPQDRLLYTREHFEDRIATTLAGRAAEEVVFGRITTGASNDLQQATRFARAMVMQFGMSPRAGLLSFDESSGSVFLGRDLSYGRNYSEATATVIDEEVNRISDEAYQRAKETLRAHRDKLEKLAQLLIEVETLDREEFEALMNQEPLIPVDEPVMA